MEYINGVCQRKRPTIHTVKGIELFEVKDGK
jgi:hypothetical protein